MAGSATHYFVTVPGSLRQAAFTRAIAGALDELAPDNVAVEMLEALCELPLYDQDLQAQGVPAAVEEAGAALARADAVVFVTPEYNHSIPGVLKNGLDWLSRIPSLPLAHKPVAIQSASPGLLGGARAQEHLRQVLVAMDAIVLNKPEVIITRCAGKVDVEQGVIRDEETRRQISLQLDALAGLARLSLTSAA